MTFFFFLVCEMALPVKGNSAYLGLMPVSSSATSDIMPIAKSTSGLLENAISDLSRDSVVTIVNESSS